MSNNQLSVEINPELHWFQSTSLCNYSIKRAPLSLTLRFKIENQLWFGSELSPAFPSSPELSRALGKLLIFTFTLALSGIFFSSLISYCDNFGLTSNITYIYSFKKQFLTFHVDLKLHGSHFSVS